MITNVVTRRAAATLIVGMATIGIAAEPRENPAPQAPSIEGTYKLVSRRLADGKVLGGPEIVGLFTYTRTHRNFNLVWNDSAGRKFSQSVISTYVLTPAQYTETVLASIVHDEIGGKGTTYAMNGSPQTVPVQTTGGRIELKMPFDPVRMVFDGDVLTCTNEGVFVDRWEKLN
jgi:hypothetical protein